MDVDIDINELWVNMDRGHVHRRNQGMVLARLKRRWLEGGCGCKQWQPLDIPGLGATWTEVTSIAANQTWRGIDLSDDGSKLVTGVSNGNLWTSMDFGATWTGVRPTGGLADWHDVASSADGSKVAAAVNGGNLWMSTDSGATWTEVACCGGPKDWHAIASSADGLKMVAAVNGGTLWRTTTDTIRATTSLTIPLTVRPTLSPTIPPAAGGSASTNADLTGSSRTTSGSSSQHPGQLDRQRRRVVVSTTLPAFGADAVMHDYDDVTYVLADVVIENTDVTSLAGWFPNLIDVGENVHVRNNGALTTIDGSFQLLETISRNLDIFGNGALAELGSAFPFPGGERLVGGYVSIDNNAVLPTLGSALEGLVTTSGYLSVYANPELTSLGTAFSSLKTVGGYYY